MDTVILREMTLFGTVDKVEISLERIRTFEPAEGYYVAFSGGKDSCVILDLVKRAGVKFDAHYNLTTVDPPELVHFIRREHPEVEVHKPKRTMWQLIRTNGPPTRINRFCCKNLKEGGGAGRLVLTGIRWQESVRRSARRLTEACMSDKSKTYLHPIIDWNKQDVWNYIRSNNVAYCSLYDEGFDRLGCVMCPQGGPRNMEKEAARWPKIAQAYKRAFARRLAYSQEHGLSQRWDTVDELYDWWMAGIKSKQGSDQTVLFE
jgi:phosphoadenosine phosphosulfate reductase